MPDLSLTALPAIPLVQAGDDLATLLGDALERLEYRPAEGDALVVAQKIVSKAERRMVALAEIIPSQEAAKLAERVQKDARLVELILRESRRVVRCRPGVLIVEHKLGFIMANAGIDRSNVAPPDEEPSVLLLPIDPDASAAALRARLHARFGNAPAVLISDSFGRAWRRGTTGVALGAAGLPSLLDLRGQPDLFGRPMEATLVGHADEIAAAASLVMGQAAEARPAVLLRGLSWSEPASPAAALLRTADEDLFR